MSSLFLLVAGAGVEPTSGDYEPPEIPFLHPAVFENFSRNNAFNQPFLGYQSKLLIANLGVASLIVSCYNDSWKSNALLRW